MPQGEIPGRWRGTSLELISMLKHRIGLNLGELCVKNSHEYFILSTEISE